MKTEERKGGGTSGLIIKAGNDPDSQLAVRLDGSSDVRISKILVVGVVALFRRPESTMGGVMSAKTCKSGSCWGDRS